MLLLAAREHQIDLTESWMIGDSDVDIAAGRSAGCKTVRLVEEPRKKHHGCRCDFVIVA